MTKEQKKVYMHKWYLANREAQMKATSAWNKSHPEKRKAIKLKHDYGITLEYYNKMLINQNYKCLLCDQKKKRLVVDHDHNTGRIRGLLCNRCNVILFYFENEERFKKTLKYLEKQVALIS